ELQRHDERLPIFAHLAPHKCHALDLEAARDQALERLRLLRKRCLCDTDERSDDCQRPDHVPSSMTRTDRGATLAHVPEKWEPVFRRGRAPLKGIESTSRSIGTGRAPRYDRKVEIAFRDARKRRHQDASYRRLRKKSLSSAAASSSPMPL